MGLTSNFIWLLERTRGQNTAFNNLATLGNQYIYSDVFELSRLWNKATAERILQANKGYAQAFYREKLNAEKITCFDFSDYEGAEIIHDFNNPVPEKYWNSYDVFLESGSLEHIFNFPVAIKNGMQLVKPGGVFIGIFPANNFCGHGFYQFSPELMFRIFNADNGFKMKELVLFEDVPFSKKFIIKDPDEIAMRMDFCNSKPVYQYVVAEKIADADIFSKLPFQSDYVTAWNNNQYGGSAKKKIVFKSPLLNTLKDWFNKKIRRGGKSFIAGIKRRFRVLGDISTKFIRHRI